MTNGDATQTASRTWDYWRYWGGSKEDIAHVASASHWALRDSDLGDPTCRIDVQLPADSETCSSHTEFLQHVSGYALRKCDGVRISVRAGATSATTLLVRRSAMGPEWMKAGALLELNTEQSAELTALPDIRRRVTGALERGRPRGSPQRLSGDGASAEDAVRQYEANLRRRPSLARTLVALGLTLAIAVVIAWAFDNYLYAPLLVLGNLVMFLITPALAVDAPRMEIAGMRSTSTVMAIRVGGLLRYIIAPVIGALAVYYVSKWLKLEL